MEQASGLRGSGRPRNSRRLCIRSCIGPTCLSWLRPQPADCKIRTRSEPPSCQLYGRMPRGCLAWDRADISFPCVSLQPTLIPPTLIPPTLIRLVKLQALCQSGWKMSTHCGLDSFLRQTWQPGKVRLDSRRRPSDIKLSANGACKPRVFPPA